VTRTPIACGGVLALALLTAACSATASVSVRGAWVRPAVVGQPTAAYLEIVNASQQPDALVAASSPDARIEIHETSIDGGGMAGMQMMPRIDVPAGSSVRLEPGATHLMVMDLAAPLRVGDHLEIRLSFERAGVVVVQADVRAG
jgi:copper(I)-binding protein